MDLSVYSEIGKLDRVLVHEPGLELDRMPPSLMEDLLFDDILYGPIARDEHQFFVNVLRAFGSEVYDFLTLLTETLASVGEVERMGLLRLISMHERLSSKMEGRLSELPPSELAGVLVHGLLALPEDYAPDHLFDLYPAVNLLFSRDAQVVLADGIIYSAMKYNIRKRESVLSRFVFSRHPQLKVENVVADFSRTDLDLIEGVYGARTLEGGDVLIFNEGIIIVGVSERTTEAAANHLAASLKNHPFFHTMIMVPMPVSRSQMHLDTIFTRLSQDECLVYAPMICPGSVETLSAISIDLKAYPKKYGTRHNSLLEALKIHSVDLKPIHCGGKEDYIQQTREQWTDGANAFSMAPGVSILYARNTRTIEELDRQGYEVVEQNCFKKKNNGELSFSFSKGKKYVVLLPATELSRGRGGPRCMTMPLTRQKL